MSESISRYIEQLVHEKNREAVQKLWDGFFERLVKLARRMLNGRYSAVSNEEDVALSAFKSFIFAAEKGRFSKLEDRNDLWGLLAMITRRKVANKLAGDHAIKRDVDKLLDGEDADGHPIVLQVLSRELNPALAAEMTEEFARLIASLEEDRYKEVALYRLEGYSNEEIAQKIQRSVSTVERRLNTIRERWTNDQQVLS